jgi:hypothetical protein
MGYAALLRDSIDLDADLDLDAWTGGEVHTSEHLTSILRLVGCSYCGDS